MKVFVPACIECTETHDLANVRFLTTVRDPEYYSALSPCWNMHLQKRLSGRFNL